MMSVMAYQLIVLSNGVISC